MISSDLMKCRRLIIPALFIISVSALAHAQITIDMCYDKAVRNYPLYAQYDLSSLSENYSVENAHRGYLPQVSVSAKGSYQSDTTGIPLNVPGMSLPGMSRDQYMLSLDASQTVWDGGAVSAAVKNIKARSYYEKKKTEADLYSIRERVNQLFFGILLIDEKLSRNGILTKELMRNLDLVNAYIEAGTASRPDADAVMVEILGARQREAELDSMRKAYVEMLSILTGMEIDENTELSGPGYISDKSSPDSGAGKRPELSMFAAGERESESRKSALYSGVMPKISIFMQGGYGRPALDMLDDDFSFFYIGGVRVIWNVSNFHTLKNSLELIETEKQGILIRKNAFLLNAELQQKEKEREIERLHKMLVNMDEIIMLRDRIRQSSGEKVKNGTLSVSELLRDINSHEAAVQEKAMYEIQLVMAVYNLRFILNS